MHVLMMEGVTLEESPNFVEWLDPESDGFMYTSKQEESWSNPHLKLCHWYVEMPEDGTPLHEEDNRRSAEPSFAWSNVVTTPQTAAAGNVTNKQSARATKGRQRGLAAKGANSTSKVNIASKGSTGSKRAAPTSGWEQSKRGKVHECDPADREEPAVVMADVAVSEAKSSKSNLQSKMNRGPVFMQGAKESLAIRETTSKPMEALILNECFLDFLAYDKSQVHDRFDRFAKKVREQGPFFVR